MVPDTTTCVSPHRDLGDSDVASSEGTLHSESWPSLEAWLIDRLQERTVWEAEGRRRAERKAAKRWWQYWI
jgi:hypothetical protein